MSHTIVRGGHADNLVGAQNPGKTSYDYLFILTENDGWHCKETHSDSMVFGIWVNRDALHIFTFDRGARTLFVAHDDTSYEAEVRRLEQLYGKVEQQQELIVQAKGEVTLRMRWTPRASGLALA